ncbi:MAG: hypothetical protein SOX82_09535 [Eubacteriales bacterium]|nr:hypothetical protein [Eubacteriales bacterium]MDY4213904.1 hypothetical protein [Eubacteriales bacterium]
MKKIKDLYFESFLSYIILMFKDKVIPYIKDEFFNSFIFKAWSWFERVIFDLKIVKFLFYTQYTAEVWYKSSLYTRMTVLAEKISGKFERTYISFDIIYTALFTGAIILIPDLIWNTWFWGTSLAALMLFYLSHNITNRTGTVLFMVNSLIFIFVILIELAFPHRAISSLVYMLFGIDFFFLVSFSIKNFDDLEKMLFVMFWICSTLCTIGFIQNNIWNIPAHGGMADGVSFGEIVVLIFPFSIMYPMEFVRGKRKYLYMGFIFIIAFNAVVSTRSRAAYIAFLIEMTILMLTNKKYAVFIILLIPLGLGTLANNLRYTVQATAMHGNAINNVINLGKKVWDLGFGVDKDKFIAIYNSANPNFEGGGAFYNITKMNLSSIYVNFIIDTGAVMLIGFMIYVLKVAHSALTSLLVGEKKYKKFFAAGLAMLVGLSVSSFFETTIFDARTMLVYWAMLGILRAVRSMNLSESSQAAI